MSGANWSKGPPGLRAEPHPQVAVGLAEDTRRQRLRHPTQGRIPQQDAEQAVAHGQLHGGGRLTAADAGAIVRPVGGGAQAR